MERYQSSPTGLTDLQESVRRAFWLAVAKGEQCGGPSLSYVVDSTRPAVESALQMLRRRNLVPKRPAHVNTTPAAWQLQIPDEFDKSVVTPHTPVKYDPVPEISQSKIQEPVDQLSTTLLSLLQKRKDQAQDTASLANLLDVSPKRVELAIAGLRDRGYNIFEAGGHVGLSKSDTTEPSTTVETTTSKLRFGACGDTHLCSTRERLDALNTVYDWYANEGITDIYHTGNIIEGEARFNVREIHTFGLENQVQYLIDNYPQRPGITTHFIVGNEHEGWYQAREGISIGHFIERSAKESGRTDLHYLGFLEHDIKFANENGSFVMRLSHPGLGSAYSISYSVQKIVESYQGGEKPAVLLVGHFHKLEYLPSVRNVRTLQTGCLTDQSTWARSRRIEYHVGAWLLELEQDEKTGACTGCRAWDRTFFDRGFYSKWEK